VLATPAKPLMPKLFVNNNFLLARPKSEGITPAKNPSISLKTSSEDMAGWTQPDCSSCPIAPLKIAIGS